MQAMDVDMDDVTQMMGHADVTDDADDALKAAIARSTAAREAADASSSDDDEALASIAAARVARRTAERATAAGVQFLCAEADALADAGDIMGGIGKLTEAIALQPHDTALLCSRARLCARINRHQATLHDAELIVKIMPDWHRGHSLCGAALFCLRQFAPSVRAYRTALAFAPPSDVAGLRSALADAQERLDSSVRISALRGEAKELERLLASGEADLTSVDTNGLTACALAAAAGQAESIRLLVQVSGCDAAAQRDRHGKTPVHFAATLGHDRCAAALLAGRDDGDALLRACDASGCDAMMCACLGGHERLATVWVGKVDLNHRTNDGSGYLHAAAQGGRASIVRLLLAKGCDPAALDTRGRSALRVARAARAADVVAILEPISPAETWGGWVGGLMGA